MLVLILLFGATRLADIGGSLGKGIKEFRRNVKDEEEEAAAATASVPAAAAPAVPSTNGEVISAVKCPACGTLNAATSKHCSECGAAIQAPVA